MNIYSQVASFLMKHILLKNSKLLASRNIVTIRQGSGTYVASSPGVVDDPLGFTFIPDKKACPGSA